jgi:threonine/homoserine/homoserine lactone efflux protein
MTPIETALALLVLLAAPGPTNALLAIAGAERGLRPALGLTWVVPLAYLATTIPLALVGANLLDALPSARAVVTLAAAAWVFRLALGMWRVPRQRGGTAAVTARQVAVTTLLNPKALIVGLVLLPAADLSRLAANVLLLAAEVLAVSLLWTALGAALRRDAGAGLPTPWRRAASVWLGALGLYLLGHVAGLA